MSTRYYYTKHEGTPDDSMTSLLCRNETEENNSIIISMGTESESMSENECGPKEHRDASVSNPNYAQYKHDGVDQQKQDSEPFASSIDEKSNEIFLSHMRHLNTQLLTAIENQNTAEVERLLQAGANANATYSTRSKLSACHVAAYADSDALSLLLKNSAYKNSTDHYGRTPMHFAACAGRNSSVGILLDFPADLQSKMNGKITPKIEEEVKRLKCPDSFLNIIRGYGQNIRFQKEWESNKDESHIEQSKRVIDLHNATPLHYASFYGHPSTVRLLLAAGADRHPDISAATEMSPLHDAAAACYLAGHAVPVDNFVETIKALTEYGGKFHTARTACFPFKTAVKLRSVEAIQILTEHIKPASNTKPIDVMTDCNGYTVLHLAIMADWLPGVKAALDGGADVTIQADNGDTAILLAARLANRDIIKEMLNAVMKISKRTPKLMAASCCNPMKIFDILTCFEYTGENTLSQGCLNSLTDALHELFAMGYDPLYEAVKTSDIKVITFMVRNGTDISLPDKLGDTTISLITERITEPTEYITSLLDSYIYTNNTSIYNRNCEITVNYRVLVPNKNVNMRVIKTLLETGNRKCQRKLLLHPLIESYLYLKWTMLSTFFYFMVFLHSLFVFSISVYIASTFHYKDVMKNGSISVPQMWNPYYWQFPLYLTVTLILIREILFINIEKLPRSLRHFSIERWTEFCTYSLAIVTPTVITIETEDTPWRRHLATVTLMLAWLNIMMLLSKTPTSGYYMQMLWKVSKEITKILLKFMFLIIMFSLCFMVQFRSQAPFDGPLEALSKTLVMITSEFEYDDHFSETSIENIFASVTMIRVLFIGFLTIAAIAFMNLMTGVAVNDVQHLIEDSNLRRLEMLVEFLNKIEVFEQKKSLYHILRINNLYKFKRVAREVVILSGKVVIGHCSYSERIKKLIMNKAQEQYEKKNKEADSIKTESKLNEILRAVTLKEQKIIQKESKLDETLEAVGLKEQNIIRKEFKLDQVLQAITAKEQGLIRIEAKLNDILTQLNELKTEKDFA